MNTKVCFKCKLELPHSDFCKSNRGSQGLQSYCKSCTKTYIKDYDLEHPDRHKRTYHKNKNKPLVKVSRLLSAQGRYKILPKEYVVKRLEELDYKCEITGVKFVFETRHPQSLSFDRIDPSKGYTPENVRFVCFWINAAMGNWGLNKLEEMVKEWISNDD